MTRTTLAGLVCVFLLAGRPAAAESTPAPARWRLEAQTVHHLSAGGESARLLNGGGVAVGWQFGRAWQLVGSVQLEGSVSAEATFRALPVGVGLRRTVVSGSRARMFARAGIAFAREWVAQYTGAGLFAREDFGTTRLDLGLGAEWRVGPTLVGAEFRLLSLSRWEEFGDAPDHPLGLGLVPRSAGGAELGLIVAVPL